MVLRGQVSVTAHIPLGIRLSKEMLLPEQLEGPAKQRQAAKSAESQTPVHTPYSQIALYTATPASHRAEAAGRLDSPAPTINVLPSNLLLQLAHLFGSCWSCLLAHPVPSLGTITMLGSFPLFSDFRLGRFAGGGIRRAVATFPRLCKPCLGITARKRTWERAHTSREERGQNTHHCAG